MRQSAPTDIDTFLASIPEAPRQVLEHLRQTIRAAAPDVTESISYGVPAFKYRGRPLVSFGLAKNHCAFYVQSPAVMDAHRTALAGFDTAKGTIRFAPERPLPDSLVRTLVQARMAETDAASAAKKR